MTQAYMKRFYSLMMIYAALSRWIHFGEKYMNLLIDCIQMRVEAIPKVYEYLESLVTTLYEEGYFGLKESVRKYVDELFDDIKTNLPTRQHKSAPKRFDKYGKGMKYASFRKNRRTTWYAFFKTYYYNGETIYLVRYIANNHTIVQYL